MAENVTELIVKYRADVSDLQAKASQIEASMRKAEGAATSAGKKTGDSFKDAAKSVESSSSVFSKVAGFIASALAVERVIAFGKESVKAFQEAELNAQKLKSAVSANGGLQADFENLIKQSQELQKVTIFSDDSIQQAQTLALQFGLTSDQVQGLIPLITDFASATGQDLNSALSAVLRGVEGNAKALKIYGIQVDSSKGKAENFASIQEQITKKFAGQAQVIGETSAGALAKLGNAYDDLKERVGGLLAPAVAGFAEIADSVLKLTEIPLSETLEKEALSFDVAKTQLSGLNVGSKERVEIIKKLQQQYPEYLGNIDAETVSNEDLNNALDKVNNSLIVKIALQKSDEDIQKQQEKTGETLRKTAEARSILERELTTIRQRANEAEVKQKLDGLPVDVQANELLQGRIKLTGISAASLGNLSAALKNYNVANLELSKQSVSTNDLIAARIQEEKDLLEIYGLEKDAKTKTETQAAKEEAAALARLKNITSVTTAELLKIRAILKGFNDLDAQDAIKKIEDELDARKKAGEKEVQNKQQALDELHALEQKISDDNLKTRNAEASKVLEIEKNKQIQLRDLVQKFSQANGGTFDEIIKQFNDTGVINLDKVKDQLATVKAPVEELDKFNQAVANVNNTFDLLIKKEIDAFNIKNLKEDLQATLDSIDFGAQNKTFTVTQKFATESPTLTDEERKAAEQRLQSDLAGIQLDADQKKLEETRKTNAEIIKIDSSQAINTTSLESDVTKDKLDELNRRTKAEQEAADQQKKIAEDLAAKKKDLEKQIVDTAISGAEQIITESIQVQSDAQIKSIETVRDAELQSIDDQIAANDKARKDGAEGRKAYESKNKELIAERVKAEDTAAAKIKAIKRQQFQADQIEAVSKIIIANVINAAEFPALAELYALLAAAQIAIVLARPNPYAKGTKSTKSGTALVGEEGPELIVMPQGAKVLTAGKTKQHADMVDAMIDNRLPDHIMKVYIKPALENQALAKKNEMLSGVNKFNIAESAISFRKPEMMDRPTIAFKVEPFGKEAININDLIAKLQISHILKTISEQTIVKKEDRFADNIANTIMVNNQGINARQLRKISREGSPVTNSKEVAKHIASEISKTLAKETKSPRRYS